jgi:RHH-type rel operon transcriptional repressor/antitoxin RelB
LRYIKIGVQLYTHGEKMTVTIHLQLDEEIIKKLEDMAKTTQCSKSHLIREAIEHYVVEYADYQIALDRLNDPHDEIISSEHMRELLANEN